MDFGRRWRCCCGALIGSSFFQRRKKHKLTKERCWRMHQLSVSVGYMATSWSYGSWYWLWYCEASDSKRVSALRTPSGQCMTFHVTHLRLRSSLTSCVLMSSFLCPRTSIDLVILFARRACRLDQNLRESGGKSGNGF